MVRAVGPIIAAERSHKTEAVEIFLSVRNGLLDGIAGIDAPEWAPSMQLIPYCSTIFP
jgi:hypothetical protein